MHNSRDSLLWNLQANNIIINPFLSSSLGISILHSQWFLNKTLRALAGILNVGAKIEAIMINPEPMWFFSFYHHIQFCSQSI
jgi:hypothetical protein